MLRSLKLRFALWFSVAATVAVGLLLILARFGLEAQILRSFELINEVEFNELKDILSEQKAIQPAGDKSWKPMDPGLLGAEDIRAVLVHDMENDQKLFYCEIYKEDGTFLFRSDNLGDVAMATPLDKQSMLTLRHARAGEIRLSRFLWKGLRIQIASSMAQAESFFESFNLVSWFLAGGTLVMSLVLSRQLSRLALDPIARLQESARHISAQDLSQRLPVPEGPREVSQLAAYLNEMFDRLETSFEQVRRFSAEASHELRTPLALIRLQAERLLKNPRLGPDETAAVAEMLEETGRLNKLIEGLLLLTRSEVGAINLNLQRLDAAGFVSDFAEDAVLLAEDAGKTFLLEHNEETAVRADPQWLRHVFLNLLSNALKFAPRGSTVHLATHSVGSRWRVVLEDEGPGVPESWLNRIFDRFARVPRAAGEPEVAGTGLGLAICRSIIERHGGTIRAEAGTDGRGLRVIIELETAIGLHHP